MNSESKNNPALRFRGFSEPWSSEKLGNLATFFSGGTPSTGKAEYYDGAIPFIKSAEINSLSTAQFLSEAGLKGSSAKRVQRGDLLYALYGATSGEVGIARIDGAINQAVLCIRSSLNRDFLYNYLVRQKSSITNTFLQGGQGNLSAEIVKSLSVPVTTPAEQQKIGAFLSSVDERIGQLARKKELLLKYKKGVMQQIFSQKIRFKDDNGNNFPDWEEKKFGSVFSFIPTNSFSRDDLNYSEGEVKNIHYGDIHTKFRPIVNVDAERIPYINGDISLKKVQDETYLRTGDVVLADASEDYADVGKCIEIGRTNGERLLAGLHTLLARPKPRTFAEGFATYLMKSWSIRWQIMRESQGTKVLGISAGRLSKVKLMLPRVEEQQKIARLLMALDEKAEQIDQQIEKSKMFKKGLLQQMFV
jgi:type I restriction enzyme, S subunit